MHRIRNLWAKMFNTILFSYWLEHCKGFKWRCTFKLKHKFKNLLWMKMPFLYQYTCSGDICVKKLNKTSSFARLGSLKYIKQSLNFDVWVSLFADIPEHTCKLLNGTRWYLHICQSIFCDIPLSPLGLRRKRKSHFYGFKDTILPNASYVWLLNKFDNATKVLIPGK